MVRPRTNFVTRHVWGEVQESRYIYTHYSSRLLYCGVIGPIAMWYLSALWLCIDQYHILLENGGGGRLSDEWTVSLNVHAEAVSAVYSMFPSPPENDIQRSYVNVRSTSPDLGPASFWGS